MCLLACLTPGAAADEVVGCEGRCDDPVWPCHEVVDDRCTIVIAGARAEEGPMTGPVLIAKRSCLRCNPGRGEGSWSYSEQHTGSTEWCVEVSMSLDLSVPGSGGSVGGAVRRGQKFCWGQSRTVNVSFGGSCLDGVDTSHRIVQSVVPVSIEVDFLLRRVFSRIPKDDLGETCRGAERDRVFVDCGIDTRHGQYHVYGYGWETDVLRDCRTAEEPANVAGPGGGP